MPQILLVHPADDPDRAAALAAKLSTPGGWSVTPATPEALAALDGSTIHDFDLVTVELSLAIRDRGVLLKDLTATRGRGPVLVTARPEACADGLAAAVADGATGLAVVDANARGLLESAARLLGEADQDTARRRLLGTLTRSTSVFEIGNDPALLPPLVARLQESVTLFSLSDSAGCARVGVALEEALSNALYHGNLELDSALRSRGIDDYYALAAERRVSSPFRDRVLRVTEELSPDQARITIRDQGPGFDTAKLTAEADDPDDDAEFVVPSGRGFMLMQAFTDEVSYNDVGNEVTLVKRRETAARVAAAAA